MALSKTLFLLFLSLPPLMVLANKLHSKPDVTKFQIDSFDTTSDSLTYECDAYVPSVGLSASSGNSNVAFFDVFSWGLTTHTECPENDVTSFKIDNFNPSSDGLRYERDAFVPSFSKSLRLVGPEKKSSEAGSVGRVLYPSWVDFWDNGRQASFETTITFLVNPINSDSSYGLTFFIIPYNTTKPTGGEGEGLGIFGAVKAYEPLFAVEFDFHDPKSPHIGIDIMTNDSEVTTPLEGAVGEIVTARIDYDGTTGLITVYATYGSSKPVTLSYPYILRSLVRQQVQIGLSASTGPNAAIFDVFSWSFTSIILTENYDIKKYVA